MQIQKQQLQQRPPDVRSPGQALLMGIVDSAWGQWSVVLGDGFQLQRTQCTAVGVVVSSGRFHTCDMSINSIPTGGLASRRRLNKHAAAALRGECARQRSSAQHLIAAFQPDCRAGVSLRRWYRSASVEVFFGSLQRGYLEPRLGFSQIGKWPKMASCPAAMVLGVSLVGSVQRCPCSTNGLAGR